MKDKFCYIFLCLLATFSFTTNVYAADISVTTESNQIEVVKGEEASVKLNLKSDTGLNACLVKVTQDNTIELVDVLGTNNWDIGENNGGTFTVEYNSSKVDDSGLSNGKNIIQLVFKANGNGKVNVEIDHCVSLEKEEKYKDIGSTSFSITANDLEKVTTLKSLTVNGGTMPAFSSNVYSYPVTLDKANFSLEMSATNPDYDDDIVVTDANGNTLDPSNMTFKSDGGQTMMMVNISVNGGAPYSLGISYEQKELDNSLSSLKINGKAVDLVDGLLDYTVEIDSDIDNIKVEAVLADSTNFKFDEGDGNYSYNADTTYIALIIEPVDAESGAASKVYNIVISKKGGLSSSSSSSKPTPSSSSPSSSISQNPQTGNISMFIMALILVSSLVGSIVLYQKNIESYK